MGGVVRLFTGDATFLQAALAKTDMDGTLPSPLSLTKDPLQGA